MKQIKYGVLGVSSEDGRQAWCLENGEPMVFKYSYEAEQFADYLNSVTNSPGIRYQARVLPPEPIEN